MDKDKIFKTIRELLDQQENAINTHPIEIYEIYKGGRDSFIIAQTLSDSNDKQSNMSFTQDEISLVNRYMLSSSFISAWYHINGEKEKRDKAAHSCSMIISNLGGDPEKVMKRYLDFERLWRDNFRKKKKGAASCLTSMLSLILLFVVFGVVLFLVF